MNRQMITALLAAALLATSGPLFCDAAETPTPQPSTQVSEDDTLSVAVLDFESSVPADPTLGQQVAMALNTALSDEPGLRLVDRADFQRILREHEMVLTGLVDSRDAAKIGRLSSAQLLISGRVDIFEGELTFYAKIVSTETSLIAGVMVRDDKETRPGPLIKQLTQQVLQKLHRNVAKLVGRPDGWKDPLPTLIKQLEGRQKPKMSVAFNETHQGPQAVPDPAAATEIRLILEKAGIAVVEGDEKTLNAAEVRYQISGDAFSEPGGHISTLISCAARVELKIVDRKSGEVVYSDRQTSRAIDLAEHIAGKTAVQKASHLLGLRVLEKLASLLSPPPAKQ